MKNQHRNPQHMKHIMDGLGAFLAGDGGQSNVEYAFILAFVTLTLITCLTLLGQTVGQSMLPLARDVH